jgi:hypothetical protein
VGESQDLREFIREQSLLSERRSQRLHEHFMAELREWRESMRRHFDAQDRKIDDLIAESQAQRDALFKMMDRLDNGGTAPA